MKFGRANLKRASLNNSVSFKIGRKAKQITDAKLNLEGFCKKGKTKNNSFHESPLLSSDLDDLPLPALKKQNTNFSNETPLETLANEAFSVMSSGDWTEDESVNQELNYNQFNLYGLDDPRSDLEEDGLPIFDKKTADISLSSVSKYDRTNDVDEELIFDVDKVPSNGQSIIDVAQRYVSQSPIQLDSRCNAEGKKGSKKQRKRELMDEAWKTELQKDVVALIKEVADVKKEVKELKRQFKKRPVSPLPNIEEDEYFDLVPKLPLKKKSRLMDLEININSKRLFRSQLIAKLGLIGGTSIKNNVINIFGELFTAKLRTKICWNGSSIGVGKIPFHPFKGLRDVLRQSVSRSFKCTRSDIDKECKLRFKQADKDYQRETERRNCIAGSFLCNMGYDLCNFESIVKDPEDN